MKKLDKLVIKSFQGPLLLTFSIAEFVLLLQFLFKQLDKIIGKGLDTIIILQLIWYIVATLVPMALPLAILLASIMTLGNFGERYELVAMKASGISLWRILRPLIVYTGALSVIAFFFANNYIPHATLKMRTILYEINTKKPTINIRPNVFFTEIDDYVIKVGAKDKDGENLSDIMIFDHSKNTGNSSITYAETGKMFSEDGGNTLVFQLFDGYSYDESSDNKAGDNHPLTRLHFGEQVIRFDVSNFAYTKTDEDRYSGHHKTMNIVELDKSIKRLTEESEEFKNSIKRSIATRLTLNNQHEDYSQSSDAYWTESDSIHIGFYSRLGEMDSERLRQYAEYHISRLNSIGYDIDILRSRSHNDYMQISYHKIEWHRKFTLSLACLILFFIGASLGAIIRKGGLGLPVVVSVICFILYYIVSITGENAIKSSLSSFWGMWISSFVFLALGIFLTYKATSDSAIMSSEGWVRIINNLRNKFRLRKRRIREDRNQ